MIIAAPDRIAKDRRGPIAKIREPSSQRPLKEFGAAELVGIALLDVDIFKPRRHPKNLARGVLSRTWLSSSPTTLAETVVLH